MNNHMVDSHFQVKVRKSCHFAKKNETHSDMFFKGAALPQNSLLLISLPLFGNYEMYCNLYNSISAVVFIKLSFQIFKC